MPFTMRLSASHKNKQNALLTTLASPRFSVKVITVGVYALLGAVFIHVTLSLAASSARLGAALAENGNDLSLRRVAELSLGGAKDGALPASLAAFSSSKCNFSLVYNKPPKTASTFIKEQLRAWSAKMGRPHFKCATNSHETAARLPECIPQATDGCGVVNCHIVLGEATLTLLRARMPNLRLMTSTRYAPLRVVSQFLQSNQIDMAELLRNRSREAEMSSSLGEGNPWTLYNYHFGTMLRGACPLSWLEKLMIRDAVMRYDIVIDVNLPEESNAILKHFNLFEVKMLSVGEGGRSNDRGTSLTSLQQSTIDRIANASCVEIELHKALQQRMASIYEFATGTGCLPRKGVLSKLSSCLADREKVALGGEWFM